MFRCLFLLVVETSKGPDKKDDDKPKSEEELIELARDKAKKLKALIESTKSKYEDGLLEYKKSRMVSTFAKKEAADMVDRLKDEAKNMTRIMVKIINYDTIKEMLMSGAALVKEAQVGMKEMKQALAKAPSKNSGK